MYVDPISRTQHELEENKAKHLKDGELKNGKKEDLVSDRQLPSPLWRPVKPLPTGWEKQWIFNSQRWKYIATATGDTQWNWPTLPGFLPLGHDPPRGSRGDSGLGGGSIDAHGELIGGKSDGSYTILLGKPHAPGGLYGEQYFTEEKTAKDEGHGGMNAGAAGGLAVGVVRGARVANAMDDGSPDEEHRRRASQEPQDYAQQPGSNSQPGYVAELGAPGSLPVEKSSGSFVTLLSDKENVHETREKPENASASDKEEARME